MNKLARFSLVIWSKVLPYPCDVALRDIGHGNAAGMRFELLNNLTAYAQLEGVMPLPVSFPENSFKPEKLKSMLSAVPKR